MGIHELLDQMEAAEQAFLTRTFLAPILPGHQVQVRIAGLRCTLRVEGDSAPGWAILRPLALDRAEIVGRPSLRQIQAFLALFPALRLLLLTRAGQSWLALPAQRGDQRFTFEGPLRVQLVRQAAPFQQIIARFDGTHCWFQEVDRRRNPALAAYLQEALAQGLPPEALHKPTLSAEERAAYRVLYEALAAARRDRVEVRLEEALAHTGASLTSYIEQEGAYSVAFTVDGHRYRSTVRQDDLTVLVAGICLAGQDQRFDLQSLVGVLREGEQRGLIYGEEG